MQKKVLYDIEARRAIIIGMDILFRVVSTTIGPKGRNVILKRSSSYPEIVTDGITVAKEIFLEDQSINLGVSLARQVAVQMDKAVGDGTTTAIIIANRMVKEGMKHILAGSNPISIEKGIDKAINFLISKLREYSISVENFQDIVHVASVASNNDMKIGRIVAMAIEKVGRDGIITIQPSKSAGLTLDVSEGIEFDVGFGSYYPISMIANGQIVLLNPYILLIDQNIVISQKQLVPILEQVAKNHKSLLIVGDSIEEKALKTLIVNRLRGIVDVIFINSSGLIEQKKELLSDLVLLTGGTLISKSMGYSLQSISLKMMGSARSVTIYKNTIVLQVENSIRLQQLCSQLKKRIDLSIDSYEKEKLQHRLSKLSGGLATISIGTLTDAEFQNTCLLIEKAINSTKAAIHEGIVPGGGAALVHLSQQLFLWSKKYLLDGEFIGALIVAEAICTPMYQIIKNTGSHPAYVVEQVKKLDFSMGYDASKNRLLDMYHEGIIDSTKVIRLALQSAASLTAIILMTECLVVELI